MAVGSKTEHRKVEPAPVAKVAIECCRSLSGIFFDGREHSHSSWIESHAGHEG